MNYYFKRKIEEPVSKLVLHIHTSYTAAAICLIFYMVGAPYSKPLTGITFGLSALITAIAIINEMKTKSACNIHYVILFFVSLTTGILSVTCLDTLLNFGL